MFFESMCALDANRSFCKRWPKAPMLRQPLILRTCPKIVGADVRRL